MTDHRPRGLIRAQRHDGAEMPATCLIHWIPAWMLTPRAFRRPYLTDPPYLEAC